VLLSAELRYLMRAGYEEARILLRRRSLESLAADTSVAADRRAAFRLVLAARAHVQEIHTPRSRTSVATHSSW